MYLSEGGTLFLQPKDFTNDVVEIQHLGRMFPATGEGQQLLGKVTASLSGAADALELIHVIRLLVEPHLQHFCVSQ